MAKRKSNAALMLAMMAAVGGVDFAPREPDRSVRDSNRMNLTDEELSKLESLSGKEKKAYVKELRAKYGK